MAYHIAVREVAAQVLKLAAAEHLDELIGDLRALHPRALIERNNVARDLDIGLKLLGELAGAIAVPKVCDVAELLRFGDSELRDSGICEVLAESICDLGRINKVVRRDMEVAIVLEHSGIVNLRRADAVELIEILACLKGARDLERAVSAEVEEDYRVAVLNSADRLSVLCDNERIEILIYCVGLLAQRLDSLLGGCEHSTVAEHVRMPAALDHRPVSLVAVHGYPHSAAAGCDLSIKIGRAERCEECLEGLDIIKRGGLSDIASVEQNVHANGTNAVLLCVLYHAAQMRDVGMDVSVGEESEEMQGRAVLLNIVDSIEPCL